MEAHGTAGWRLVVSDLDGTLVSGTALAHLGTCLGRVPALPDVETGLARRRLTDREVAEAFAPSYAGVRVSEAVAAMSSITALTDVESGVALLRQRGVETLIATVSWRFAAQTLAERWGFSGAHGAELEVDQESGSFTGRVARHFAPDDKVSAVEAHCRRSGFGLDAVVAIGDGRSDLPLFRAAGFSVALNASRDARACADVSVDSTSFLTALRAVPALLS